MIVGASVVIGAQIPAAPTFEVASVRLSTPATFPSQQVLDTRIVFLGQSLRSLLLFAFRAKNYQLVAPDWAGDVRVDIQATLPAGATRGQIPDMLQGLLAGRFGLVVHREWRPLEVHELTVDGNGIKKMEEVEPLNELDREVSLDPAFAAPTARAFADRVSETPDGPVRTIISGGGEPAMTTVTARSMYRLTLTDHRTQILNATRMTMTDLAGLLDRVTGQPIIDKTNLHALYRFTIELPPDNLAREVILRGGFDASRTPSLASPPVVLVTEALEGLGLRLGRSRSPIETIVVDSMERSPTEN